MRSSPHLHPWRQPLGRPALPRPPRPSTLRFPLPGPARPPSWGSTRPHGDNDRHLSPPSSRPAVVSSCTPTSHGHGRRLRRRRRRLHLRRRLQPAAGGAGAPSSRSRHEVRRKSACSVIMSLGLLTPHLLAKQGSGPLASCDRSACPGSCRCDRGDCGWLRGHARHGSDLHLTPRLAFHTIHIHDATGHLRLAAHDRRRDPGRLPLRHLLRLRLPLPPRLRGLPNLLPTCVPGRAVPPVGRAVGLSIKSNVGRA